MTRLSFFPVQRYTEKLGSALGGWESVPNTVGLGTLVISIVLELVVGKSDQMSTGDILCRVSAEEKASENSMMKDGFMSTTALSHQVNGAAFHTQVLIHQACLEGGDGARATAAVDLYQQDLSLNDNYQTHVTDFSRQLEIDIICDIIPPEHHVTQDYNKGMEDMRRLMEAEMREMEEKLRTATKIMVLKERESWKSERQQLLDEKITLQRQLSITETANRMLESDLNRAEETIGRLEEEISSLNHQFSALKETRNNSRIILWRALKKKQQKAEEEMRKRRTDHLSSTDPPRSERGHREDGSLGRSI
eukprot:superscaffoldBa00000611_g6050